MEAVQVDLKSSVRRWFEQVWNQKNADAIDELFAEGGLGYGINTDGSPVHGPAEFRQVQAVFVHMFPDMHFVVEEVLQDGDMTAARFTVTGTHQGEAFGVPATGKQVRFSGMAMVRWQDGKIVEGWNNFDQFQLFKEIGAVQTHL
jgi:steroid delta-isomerase-like uncharacterized protein